MTKEEVTHKFKSHHWVCITHKRGYARYCMNCGKIRYMGRPKLFVDFLRGPVDDSIMVYEPNALAPPVGAPDVPPLTLPACDLPPVSQVFGG